MISKTSPATGESLGLQKAMKPTIRWAMGSVRINAVRAGSCEAWQTIKIWDKMTSVAILSVLEDRLIQMPWMTKHNNAVLMVISRVKMIQENKGRKLQDLRGDMVKRMFMVSGNS